MRLARLIRAPVLATKDIDGGGHGLKVFGIDAHSNATKVIDMQTIAYATLMQRKRNAMRQFRRSVE